MFALLVAALSWGLSSSWPHEASAASITSKYSRQTRPHVVLLVLDDLGRSDHTVFESSSVVGYATPTLERLAKKEGAVLSNYYTQAECSPTRAALLTGRFPFRLGLQFSLVPGSTAGLPAQTPTLAEMLRGLGYTTHAVGKWHLGSASVAQTPTSRGFDSFYGFLQGRIDYFNKTLMNGFDFWSESRDGKYRRPARFARGNYSVEQYAERVSTLVKSYVADFPEPDSRAQEPLFLYYAMQSVHVPLEASRRRRENTRCEHSRRAVFCAMAVQMDDAVANLERDLRTAKLWDDSLVVVTTDNGGAVPLNGKGPLGRALASLGSNFPLRGGKATLFEGGVRATAFVTGGRLHPDERGKHYAGLAHAVDIAAFILRAASDSGDVLQKSAGLDGLPLVGLQLATDDDRSVVDGKAPPGRTWLPINVVDGGRTFSAVRWGRYKLIVGAADIVGADGWWPPQADGPATPASPRLLPSLLRGRLLFDVESDPRETTNLAHNLSSVVHEGERLIASVVESGEYREPQGGNVPHLGALPNPLNAYAWRPFLDNDHEVSASVSR